VFIRIATKVNIRNINRGKVSTNAFYQFTVRNCLNRFRLLSAFAEDHGRKPMDECDGRTLRPLSAIADYGRRRPKRLLRRSRQGRCFGGFRRRKEGYHGCKPVEASLARCWRTYKISGSVVCPSVDAAISMSGDDSI